jgi:hypothetical protein
MQHDLQKVMAIFSRKGVANRKLTTILALVDFHLF